MGIRNALRQATSLQHHSLEEHPLLAALQSQDVTVHTVIRILQAFAAYHAAAARSAHPFAENLGYRPFPHASVLTEDLRRLGSAPDPELEPELSAFTSPGPHQHSLDRPVRHTRADTRRSGAARPDDGQRTADLRRPR